MRVTPPSSSGGFGQGPQAERTNRDGQRRQQHQPPQGQAQMPQHEADVVELHKEVLPPGGLDAVAGKVKPTAAPSKTLDLSA